MRRFFTSLVLGTLLLTTSACSVLTKSQIEAVKQFALATENYGQLPGDAIRGYRDVVFTRQALEVGRSPTKDDASEALHQALEQRDQSTDAAARADRALQILDDYSAMLGLLVSDNYTSELDSSVTDLATQLDAGIKLYNAQFRADQTPLDSFGAIVAAGIRGAGGIWIRHKQTVALREAVTKADPVVAAMTSAIEELATVWLTETPPKGTLIERERQLFENSFLNSVKMAADHNQAVDLGVTERVVDILDRARNTAALAAAAKSAATRYRVAHEALAKAVTGKGGLQGLADQLTSLNNEIQAARKLQKKLKS